MSFHFVIACFFLFGGGGHYFSKKFVESKNFENLLIKFPISLQLKVEL